MRRCGRCCWGRCSWTRATSPGSRCVAQAPKRRRRRLSCSPSCTRPVRLLRHRCVLLDLPEPHRGRRPRGCRAAQPRRAHRRAVQHAAGQALRPERPQQPRPPAPVRSHASVHACSRNAGTRSSLEHVSPAPPARTQRLQGVGHGRLARRRRSGGPAARGDCGALGRPARRRAVALARGAHARLPHRHDVAQRGRRLPPRAGPERAGGRRGRAPAAAGARAACVHAGRAHTDG